MKKEKLTKLGKYDGNYLSMIIMCNGSNKE